MNRLNSLDAYRGIAIALMIFFTLIQVLSNNLPELLLHNIAGMFYFGDFVLTMFVFASGMSIVFFIEKRKAKLTALILDSIERFAKLFIIGIVFSLFSAGYWFGMDPIMLMALLFVISIPLYFIQEYLLVVISVTIYGFYFLVGYESMSELLRSIYLGGYSALPFYLPVFLAGIWLGKQCLKQDGLKESAILASISIAVGSVVYVFIPIDKMVATPSFMILAIGISSAVFMMCQYAYLKFRMRIGFLEYIGMKPLRYWIMMIVFFIIPRAICIFQGNCSGNFGIDWMIASWIGTGFLIFLIGVSKIIDIGHKFVVEYEN